MHLEMETVKGKILNLEIKIKELESKLQHMGGSTPLSKEIRHDILSNEEFIEYNLYEDLFTLKFAYRQRIDHGRTEKKYYEYYLLNPTDEMKDIVGDYNSMNNPDGSPIVLMSFCEQPNKLEEYGYELKVVDPSGPLGNEKNRKKIKQELDKYFFSVADICSCGIRPTIFHQEITFPFKREYERLPHFTYYITPFSECSHIVASVKSLTTKEITFTFTQRHNRGDPTVLPSHMYNIPEDASLHVNIRGITSINDTIDLLSPSTPV